MASPGASVAPPLPSSETPPLPPLPASAPLEPPDAASNPELPPVIPLLDPCCEFAHEATSQKPESAAQVRSRSRDMTDLTGPGPKKRRALLNHAASSLDCLGFERSRSKRAKRVRGGGGTEPPI